MSLRRRAHEVLEGTVPGDRAARAFSAFIVTLILANVAALIVGTLPGVEARYGRALAVFEVASVAVFTVEYLARSWAIVESPKYAAPVTGRLRFAATPLAIVDLVAIVPAFLPFLGADLRFVRVLRFFRLLRLFKLGRYSESLRTIGNVVRESREELAVSLAALAVLLVLTSSAIYFAENAAQPEAFASIPHSMYWSIVTLTTVGYGDVVPVTPLGRTLAAATVLLGVLMVALPTAILSSSFLGEIQKRKQKRRVCAHCGRDPDSNGAHDAPPARVAMVPEPPAR